MNDMPARGKIISLPGQWDFSQAGLAIGQLMEPVATLFCQTLGHRDNRQRGRRLDRGQGFQGDGMTTGDRDQPMMNQLFSLLRG